MDHHDKNNDKAKDRAALEKAILLAASDPDIPSIGQSSSKLAEADEDRHSIETICEIALSDPALAQKIIRAAGSAAMGSTNNGKPWSLSRALMALGMEQVRAMALALNLMDVAKTRQATLGRTSIGEALAGCFCAREAARALGADRDGWGLRTLFLGCLPFFLDLYDPHLGNRIKLEASIGNKPWSSALVDMCSMNENELLDKLLAQWGFPHEARKAPGNENISSVALGLSRALNMIDIKAAQACFSKEASRWDARTLEVALSGLAKGANLGTMCSLAPRGALAKEALKKSASRQGWDAAARYWQTCAATEPINFEAPPQASPTRSLANDQSTRAENEAIAQSVSMLSNSKDAEPADEASIQRPPLGESRARLSRIASELAQQALDGATRDDIALQGLEALTFAIGMDRGLCAFGSSLKDANLCAALGGGRPWAKAFIANRAKDRIDLFNHALSRGADACCADASLMQSSLPAEIAPDGCPPQKAFAFFPLGSKTKPRGYALFSAGKPRVPFTTPEIEEIRGFFSQWALALAMARPTN